MKKFFIAILTFAALNLNAADVPIIFVHGNKGEGNRDAGWRTWYPTEDGGLEYQTAMTKIIAAQYRGYKAGLRVDGTPALECDTATPLQSMPDTKRIYNFAYYHPNGNPGVIALTEESVLVYKGIMGSNLCILHLQ